MKKAEDKKRNHHWREKILKFGPNTEAREELLSKMAERLDLAEEETGDLTLFLYEEVRELRSAVDQIFELLITKKPGGVEK